MSDAASGYEAQATALRFDTADDALDHAYQIVERGKGWCTRQSWRLVERYMKSELDIVLEFGIRTADPEYQLTFFRVPDGWERYVATNHLHAFNVEIVERSPDLERDSVLVRVPGGV